ncbi:MAG: efflux transporter outer membrane subunit [Gammaproteobacteria bacterium]
MRWRGPLFVVTLLALGGCAAGPDYVPPKSYQSIEQAPLNLSKWWERFGDAQLNAQVERALQSNYDIVAARATVREARAQRDVARSAFLPSVNLESGYTFADQSINSPAGAGPLISAGLIDRDVEFWSSTLSGRWDLDLFGGTRRLNEAARARVQQSIAARDAVALGVVAETVSAWFELRGALARRANFRNNLTLQSQSLEIIEKRVAIGLARDLDALRARGQREAVASVLPTLDAAIDAAARRLAVLGGRPLDSMTANADLLGADGVFAALSFDDVPSVPAASLRARPDVAAAERNLAAVVAELGVSEAAFFPKLWIGASAGLESASLADLVQGNSRVLGLAPRLSLPIFQGGRLRANQRAARARADAAYADLENVLLAGLAEAHSARAAVDGQRQSLQHLRASAAASARAQGIAQGLYDRGLGDFLSLLDAQRERIARDDEVVQAQTRLRLELVRLFTSLGGDASQLLAIETASATLEE